MFGTEVGLVPMWDPSHTAVWRGAEEGVFNLNIN